ncbi:MAG: uroporphyrinogen-III synthase [Bergeyella sp.]|nr:uroporphyrinogen-III synthase [Bergeyella sp.]
MKIKSILVSQPAPRESSPYMEIAKKEKIKIDFRPFIHVEGLDVKDLRAQKIDLARFTGIIFTSKNAVDHYFRLCEEMRYSVPDTMRYVCQSEAIANYLQKHIVYRKRKISFGEKTFSNLVPIFKKLPNEKFLLPSSDVLSPQVTKILDEAQVDWTRAIMYKTVYSDLSDIKVKDYDMLVFFSPHGIKSLRQNFENFNQGDVRIAVFGNTTQKAAEEAGLRVDIVAPSKEVPSMTMAVERYIKQYSK